MATCGSAETPPRERAGRNPDRSGEASACAGRAAPMTVRPRPQLTGESETRENDLPERNATSVQSKGGNDDTPAQAVPAQFCSVERPRFDRTCPELAVCACAGGSEHLQAADARRNAAQ